LRRSSQRRRRSPLLLCCSCCPPSTGCDSVDLDRCAVGQLRYLHQRACWSWHLPAVTELFVGLVTEADIGDEVGHLDQGIEIEIQSAQAALHHCQGRVQGWTPAVDNGAGFID